MTTTGYQEIPLAQLREHEPPLSLVEAEVVIRRFWQHVRKAEGDGCWTFTGKPMRFGHCRASIGRRKTMLAHRLSYVLSVGPLADDECVLHRCDNPPCIRPEHLFKGDRGDNARDMAAKGRQHVQRNPAARPVCPPERKSRGAAHYRTRFTEAQISDIRRRAISGEKRPTLAREFGVHISTIYAIATGATWAHVGGPRLEVVR